MQTIYLVVSGKIRQAQARIVGKIAEVQTEVGIREFGVFYLTREEAQTVIDGRKK